MGGVPPTEDITEPEVEPSLLTHSLVGLKGEKLLTASPDISVAEVIDLLKEQNADFLVVVDDTGKLAGVFSGKDVLAKVACQIEDLSEAKLASHMTSDVAVLMAEATIADALQIMSARTARHIPIVDNKGRPEGVISFRSVIRYLETQFLASERA